MSVQALALYKWLHLCLPCQALLSLQGWWVGKTEWICLISSGNFKCFSRQQR